MFFRTSASVWMRFAAVVVSALLLMAACSGDDDGTASTDGGSDDSVAQSDEPMETDAGTDPQDEEESDDDAGEEEEEDEADHAETVEGATPRQQKRVDSGKPTVIVLAPEDGASVESPMRMRFDIHNGEIVENRASTEGYVIFVKVGKGSNIPVFDDEAEIPLMKEGRTKVTVMLGGQKGPIRKSGVSLTVDVTGAEGDGGDASGG